MQSHLVLCVFQYSKCTLILSQEMVKKSTVMGENMIKTLLWSG